MTTEKSTAPAPFFADVPFDADAMDFYEAAQKRMAQAKAITRLLALAADCEEPANRETAAYAGQAVADLLHQADILTNELHKRAAVAEKAGAAHA